MVNMAVSRPQVLHIAGWVCSSSHPAADLEWRVRPS